MTWSLIIIDDGITDDAQARAGKQTAIEYDYYFDFPDTDDGISDTHGDRVFLSALGVSRAYDVIDLKVASAEFGDYLPEYTELALLDVLDTPEVPVGAINLSFGGPTYPFQYADEIAQLAALGIICVVSAGNDGARSTIESPLFPAALPDVICVGSHDGAGRPSDFSQNGPAVDILADGEDVPRAGSDGTSFAAPRVAATVTHVQAIVDGLTGNVLDVAQVIDVLQQGGAGPRSRPDPADGHTRYFLHDHDGSLDYAWSRYGGSTTVALEYVASHQDLINALGADARSGQLHFERMGSIEQRAITFDSIAYIASYTDLVSAFGVDGQAGAAHFITAGLREGRSVTFNGLDYIASYGDLIGAFGTDEDAAALHFVASGAREGRSTTFDGLEYIASYGDLIATFGPNEHDGATHFIANGYREGRSVAFDGLDYIASYGDLISAFGAETDAGSRHFITNGFTEGRRPDLFDAEQYLANYRDLRVAFGSDEEAATRHFITNGFAEGRTDDPGAAAAADFLI